MSHQKSNRTLLLEQERAARKAERIRKREEKKQTKKTREERKQQKAAEREGKREERLKKQFIHESVERNGVPRVRDAGAQLGIRDAIAYSEYVLCEGCHNAIHESSMIGKICERCHYSKEVNDEGLKLEANRAVPGTEDGGKNGTVAPAGQLSLLI